MKTKVKACLFYPEIYFQTFNAVIIEKIRIFLLFYFENKYKLYNVFKSRKQRIIIKRKLRKLHEVTKFYFQLNKVTN